MTDVSLSASDVLQHLRNGAKLYREFSDKIELRIPGNGTVIVPLAIFDALIDEHKIVSESGQVNGFYRLA